MEKSEQQFSEVMPQIAHQMRVSLVNFQNLLQKLTAAAEEKQSVFQATQTVVLLHQYYQALRLAINLNEAGDLYNDKPLPLTNQDIVSFCRDICWRCEYPAEQAGKRVLFFCDKREHRVAFCRSALQRLLYQLLENAIRHTPKGTTIRVKLTINRTQVLLQVEDDGYGIPLAWRDTLFSLDSQVLEGEMTLERAAALRLGLPLAYHAACRMGGTLMFMELDQGSCFACQLPNRQVEEGLIRAMEFDYTGGYNPTMVELAYAIPSIAYEELLYE